MLKKYIGLRWYLEAPIPNNPKGLLVVLHGGFDYPEKFALTTKFHELTDQYVVVYPRGSNTKLLIPTWNETYDSNDEKFLEKIVLQYGLPTYLTGLSDGANMSYRYAVDHMVRAIAPVAGRWKYLDSGVPSCSLFHIHGMNDNVSSFDGGYTIFNEPIVPAMSGIQKFIDAGYDVRLDRPDGGHTWEQPNYNTTIEILNWLADK